MCNTGERDVAVIRREPSESWKACQLCTAQRACPWHAAEAAAFWSGVAQDDVPAGRLARAVTELDAAWAEYTERVTRGFDATSARRRLREVRDKHVPGRS